MTEWFASIYTQTETTIAFVLDAVRKNGEDVGDFVVVVADMTDEPTRFFVDQLGDARADPAMPGFVGAIPKSTVARVLRLMEAGPFADNAEMPVEEGLMRVLIAARGQVQCADVPASPPMVRGGTA
ncbi:MAG TPA: hypothetical protein VM925_01405 [Labilithrix sp.]|nr:hypothetical protein [Labilithrix sp.]